MRRASHRLGFTASLLIHGGLLGGLWLVFIGWFVLSAARGSTTQMVLERGLSGLSVREVVDPDPPNVVVAGSDQPFDAVAIVCGLVLFEPLMND